jgi:chemotaxis protein MotB
MARERQKVSGKKPIAEWMPTFSDMVTLIMTFFVLLFSMSNIDIQKMEALASSYAGRPIVLQGGSGDTLTSDGPSIVEGMTGGPEIITEDTPVDTGDSAPSELEVARAEYFAARDAARDEMAAIASDLRTYAAEHYFSSQINVVVPPESEYMVITFDDGVLFDSGRADVKSESWVMLDYIANELLKYPGHRIRVLGHTDNIPQRNPSFASNWHLSAARASSVVQFFVDEKGFDPTLVSAEGRGEYEPVAANDTPEGRALNRRVEIWVYARFEGAEGFFIPLD